MSLALNTTHCSLLVMLYPKVDGLIDGVKPREYYVVSSGHSRTRAIPAFKVGVSLQGKGDKILPVPSTGPVG
jgi:hypothetical protein